jgi:hypothetical protein
MGDAGMQSLSSILDNEYPMSDFQKIAFKKSNGEVVETMMPEEKVDKIIEQMGSDNCWRLY